MTQILLTLVLAVVIRTQPAALQNINRFSLNPINVEGCSGFDPFISSTEHESKFYLHPWKTDERKGDWYHNRAYCAKHCAEMVTIHSEEQNTFFHTFIRNVGMVHPGAWLGAQSVNKADISHWYNGERMGYCPKAPGEYNEPGLTCLDVGWENNKNWWRNFYCNDNRHLIVCQRNTTAYATILNRQTFQPIDTL